ncbi:hypothetical protein PJL15_01284 [Paenarthrobacter nitroguajacolicus]|nr:hypothetical protein [Paenarthrobacter nitroguajacolicus]
MAGIRLNKADLSVDNVHTLFGLTQHQPSWLPHSRNEPNQEL